jgi:hypothetical protein
VFDYPSDYELITSPNLLIEGASSLITGKLIANSFNERVRLGAPPSDKIVFT